MSNKCVTNPVPASQVVDVNQNWQLLTVPDCTNLTSSLQVLIDALSALHNVEITLGCLIPVNTTIPGILQAMADKICAVEATVLVPIVATPAAVELSLCTDDNFACTTTSPCLVVTPCAGTPTLEEQMQMVVSRVVALSRLVKVQCTEITALQDRVTVLEAATSECCETTELNNRILLLESQITVINNNCC